MVTDPTDVAMHTVAGNEMLNPLIRGRGLRGGGGGAGAGGRTTRVSQNQDSNNSGFVVSADTTNDQAWERLRDAVIQNAVLAYDMRDSAHDADFLSYLWASVERYKAALPARLRGKAPSEFEPGKGWRGSDGAFYRRPEQ